MNIQDIELQTRFDRRYENDKREWVEDTSIDQAMEKIRELICYHDTYFYLLHDLYIRHYFYCCGCSSADINCWDLDDLNAELATCKAGDILYVWVLDEETPQCIIINCPDKDGLFPRNGAY